MNEIEKIILTFNCNLDILIEQLAKLKLVNQQNKEALERKQKDERRKL